MTDPQGIVAGFNKARADYDMSRNSRFVRRRTGVAPQGGPADYHYRAEAKYYNDMEQARDMDRNDGLVGTLADRRVDNIVQQGFSLDVKTGDAAIDEDLEARWEDFANDPEQCDIAGELCWHEIERVVCRAESIDGDIVVTGTEDGPFQVIEAHQIQTASTVPGVFLGVARNKVGRRESYYVRYDLDEHGKKSGHDELSVRDDGGVRQVFHVYNPKRVYATRGVTQLAPIFSLSGMLEDVNFAKLVQQQAVSVFAVLHEVTAGSTDLPSIEGVYGEGGTETTDTGTRKTEGVSPGMEYFGRAGETLKGFSPNVPNAEYFDQVKLLLQIIGVNFGLPLCLVLMDGSETNFSGWRGAVDEARKGFVSDQENLVRRLHKPGYIWWLNRLMQGDASLRRARKRQGINILGHNWNLPTWTYIEPVADAEGDATQLRFSLTSPRRLHSARGSEWAEVSTEIIEDNTEAIAKAKKAAAKINANDEDGAKVTWRDLINLPMQEGVTMSMQDPAAQDDSAATPETSEAA